MSTPRLQARWQAVEFHAVYRGCEITVFRRNGGGVWYWTVAHGTAEKKSIFLGVKKRSPREAMRAAERWVVLAPSARRMTK